MHVKFIFDSHKRYTNFQTWMIALIELWNQFRFISCHFGWPWSHVKVISSVQASPLTGWSEGHERWFSRLFSSLFCGRLSWAVLAWTGTSVLWQVCPFSISSASHGIIHPPRLPWRMVLERLSWQLTFRSSQKSLGWWSYICSGPGEQSSSCVLDLLLPMCL